jgi:hypothetical protein
MDFLREATVDDMKWLNLTLALLGSLAAFGSLNKMVWGATRPCIIGATLLIALGLAGQWLSLIHEEWLQYVDTALYGGILALLIASQRNQTWFLERWANPAASAVALWAGVIFMLGLLTGCAQAAEPSKTEIPVLTFEAEGIQANLMSGPCTNGQAAMAIVMGLPQFAERFRAIESTWPMQDGSRRSFEGCWAELKAEEAGTPVDVVIMVFEDRTAFAVPRTSFVKLRGQSGV